MPFPEYPAPGLTPYEHMRPYLYAKSLRFSFGAMKGSPQWNWQKELSEMNFDQAFEFIKSKGFKAIYVNRKGFQDGGEALLAAFQEKSGGRLIQSSTGDLAMIVFPSTD
jgi:phosphoglycerol transferase